LQAATAAAQRLATTERQLALGSQKSKTDLDLGFSRGQSRQLRFHRVPTGLDVLKDKPASVECQH
jgi:hypothetical protein